MRRSPLVLVVVGIAAVALAPPGSSAGFGCASYAPGTPGSTALAVPGPFPSTLTSPCGSGKVFASATPACPLSTVPTVQPGEYCGATAAVLPGQTVTCTAWFPGALFAALVVGLDETNTGNIGNPSLPLPVQLAYDGVFPGSVHTVTITNTGLPATVIAHPVGVPSTVGPVLVDCA